MIKSFYNYVYLDPRKPGDYIYGDYSFNYEPMYIGKGKKDRIDIHLKKKYKHKFINKIKKIIRLGLEPIRYKLFESKNENLVLENEIKLIKTIGREDLGLGPLLNLTDGGEGVSGFKQSKEIIEKLSKKAKKRFEDPKEREKISIGNKKRFENPKERKKLSEGQKKRYENPKEREKISIGNKNKSKSKEHCKKLSEGQKKRFEDPKEKEKQSKGQKKRFEDPKEREKISKATIGKNNPNAKKLYQYNKLNLIKLWSYIKECSLNNPDLKYCGIKYFANYNLNNPNDLKSYKGYIFSYIELNKKDLND